MKKTIVYFVVCLFIVVNLVQTVYAYNSGEKYSVIRKTYKRNGIHINFPKINGFFDTDKLKEINYLLERESFRIVKDFISRGTSYDYKQKHILLMIDEMAFEMPDKISEFTYTIGICNDKIISIHYNIFDYWPGNMPHPYSYSDSFTIDIQNLKVLKLDDLFIDINSIINYKHETELLEKHYIINEPAQGSLLDAVKSSDNDKENALIEDMHKNWYAWHINNDSEFVVDYLIARFIEQYKIPINEIKNFINKNYYSALEL